MKINIQNGLGTFLLIALLLSGGFAFAGSFNQDGAFDIGEFFGSFPSLVAFTVLASGQVIDWLNLRGFGAQAVSWAMGVVLVLLAKFAFKVGFIMEVEPLWLVIVNGVGVALASNGVFDVPIVQSIIAFLSASKNKNR